MRFSTVSVPSFSLALRHAALAALVLGASSAWAAAPKEPAAPLKVTIVTSPDDVGQNGVGDEVQVMTQTVIDDYNEANAGPPIDLQVLDSKTTDAKALAQQAAGSIALISCVGKTQCLMQAGVAKELNIPLIGPMTGDASLRGKDMAHVFPLRPSDADTIQDALNSLVTMRIKKVAVLVQGDAYGKSLDTELGQQKLPGGLSVAIKENISAQTNFPALTQRMEASGATAVLFLSDDVPTVSKLIAYWGVRRKTSAAYTPMLMHLDGLTVPAYAEKLAGYPGGALFVTIVPNPWGGRRQAQRDYQQLAQSKGIYRASYGSFEAYLNARLLVTAVRNGKATSGAKLMEYLRSAPISLGGLSVRYAGGKTISTGFLDEAILGSDGAFRH